MTAAPAPGPAELLAALQDPAAFPDGGDAVEIRQTHISLVFLTGGRAYKIKKPVDLGFVDYSTLERRRAFCDAEVTLNRRLAPDVYLGVEPVVRRDGGLAVGGPGDPLEWAVVMRRLPYAWTLADRLAHGALPAGALAALAARLADFHVAAAPAPAGRGFGSAAAFRPVLDANLAGTAAGGPGICTPAEHGRLVQCAGEWMNQLAPLMDARVADGAIRDCHGDLRLDHVYLEPDRPPPDDWLVIDCIEFNDGFRCIDPVSDIAFLVMDLAVHGHVRDAGRFADAWFAAAGDDGGAALLPLHVLNRALVRAKVEALRAAEPEVPADARARSRERARQHVVYALGVCDRGGVP